MIMPIRIELMEDMVWYDVRVQEGSGEEFGRA